MLAILMNRVHSFLCTRVRSDLVKMKSLTLPNGKEAPIKVEGTQTNPKIFVGPSREPWPMSLM